jgi:hypothetical protein
LQFFVPASDKQTALKHSISLSKVYSSIDSSFLVYFGEGMDSIFITKFLTGLTGFTRFFLSHFPDGNEKTQCARGAPVRLMAEVNRCIPKRISNAIGSSSLNNALKPFILSIHRRRLVRIGFYRSHPESGKKNIL